MSPSLERHVEDSNKKNLDYEVKKDSFTSFTFVVRSFGDTKEDMKNPRFVRDLFFWMGGHHFI
jgi:hypothetical protein